MVERVFQVLPLPTPSYDDHDNPMWTIMMPVTITRLDNSLALQEAVGKIGNDGTNSKSATIGRGMGSVTWILSVKQKGKSAHYAMNCEPALMHLFDLSDKIANSPTPKKRKKS